MAGRRRPGRLATPDPEPEDQQPIEPIEDVRGRGVAGDPDRVRAIRPEHLDELRQRYALIQDHLADAQRHRDLATRADLIATQLMEAQTAWLAQEYGLAVAQEQWQIDIGSMTLHRVDNTDNTGS